MTRDFRMRYTGSEIIVFVCSVTPNAFYQETEWIVVTANIFLWLTGHCLFFYLPSSSQKCGPCSAPVSALLGYVARRAQTSHAKAAWKAFVVFSVTGRIPSWVARLTVSFCVQETERCKMKICELWQATRWCCHYRQWEKLFLSSKGLCRPRRELRNLSDHL